MYGLEYIRGPQPDAALTPGTRIPITPDGVVFVGESRSRQYAVGARVVVLGDTTVTSGGSGHCVISVTDGKVTLYDCGSDNGTWLVKGNDAERVGSRSAPTTVLVGTEIAIGRCRFRLIEIPVNE